MHKEIGNEPGICYKKIINDVNNYEIIIFIKYQIIVFIGNRLLFIYFLLSYDRLPDKYYLIVNIIIRNMWIINYECNNHSLNIISY